jgi:hypothetical protein
MTESITKRLARLGFIFDRGGVHSARTMMLEDLKLLFSFVSRVDVVKDDYLRSIVEENCLGKQTRMNRKITFRHLKALYGLDPFILIFRALRYFWDRDETGRPLLAFLCAYARDPLLRMSAPFVLPIQEGKPVSRPGLESFIENINPGRFSKATLLSLAQNICSSWTQSGHLSGKVNKTRSHVVPTPGAVAFALFLSYVSGHRGMLMLETEYSALLDCSPVRMMELAREESLNGGIVFKQIADVIEVSFPGITRSHEMEWIRD